MSQEKPIAAGLSATQWVKLLESECAKNAHKALSYLDGKQEELMIKLLSDPSKGRKKWQERGIIPRYRNLTKMIVEKSGMLFKDKAPSFEIYPVDSDVENEEQTQRLAEELYRTEWQEVFTNLDQVVRLLKTGLILIQYNVETEELIFDILTRANSQVIVNPSTRQIDALIYRTAEYEDTSTYRIITKDEYIDLVKIKEAVTVAGTSPNPYGIVPVATFYDTAIPRSGFWNDPAMDLVALNEMVNLHITDSEYAISWAKLPTLFTNCKFANDEIETFTYEQVGTEPLPRQMPMQEALLGGPSKAILIDSAGVDSPFIKYESPKVDISPLDKVVDGWIKSYAEDWSVSISGADNARATSGFQLLVEEIDNLDLRKRRQRMFEAGFKRFYKIVAQVVNVVKPGTFDMNAELFVEFPDPYLPVDTKEQEEVWSLRIAEGRASTVDYLVEVHGFSRSEAEEKLVEIAKDQAMFKALMKDVAPPEPSPDAPPIEPVDEEEGVEPTPTSEDDDGNY